MTVHINRRSVLFYSALAGDRWDEVLTSGADMVCFDLEDGTVPERRPEARERVLALFARRHTGPVRRLLRINNPRTADGMRDMLALLEAASAPDGLILPKVETAEEVRWVAGLLCPKFAALEFVVLIETPKAVRNVAEIAAADPHVSCLFLGTADYSGEMGSELSWDALAYARGRLVAAAAEFGLDAMDGAWFDPDDMDGLKAELARLAAMGFTGKASYDAHQIPHIHAAFTPSAEKVAQARRVLAAARGDGTGITRLDGRMVNESIAKKARRTLAIAARRGVAPANG